MTKATRASAQLGSRIVIRFYTDTTLLLVDKDLPNNFYWVSDFDLIRLATAFMHRHYNEDGAIDISCIRVCMAKIFPRTYIMSKSNGDIEFMYDFIWNDIFDWW